MYLVLFHIVSNAWRFPGRANLESPSDSIGRLEESIRGPKTLHHPSRPKTNQVRKGGALNSTFKRLTHKSVQ